MVSSGFYLPFLLKKDKKKNCLLNEVTIYKPSNTSFPVIGFQTVCMALYQKQYLNANSL